MRFNKVAAKKTTTIGATICTLVDQVFSKEMNKNILITSSVVMLAKATTTATRPNNARPQYAALHTCALNTERTNAVRTSTDMMVTIATAALK